MKILAVSSLISLVMVCSACSLTPTPVSTPTPSGIPVTFGNISLFIPEGLATGASFKTSINVELPYINPSFGDMPEHTVLTLDGYATPGRSGRVLIFKSDDYAAYTDFTQQIVSALQLLKSGQVYPDDLYIHPYTNSLVITATGTTGLRSLNQIMTGMAPYDNEDIFYYYVGLSNDGKYFIEAILPVKVSFLPADSSPNSVTPVDGVQFPFNIDDMLGFQEKFREYSALIKEKLNYAAPEAFTPALATLDMLIGSISIIQ